VCACAVAFLAPLLKIDWNTERKFSDVEILLILGTGLLMLGSVALWKRANSQQETISAKLKRAFVSVAVSFIGIALNTTNALAQAREGAHEIGGEANLKLPDLSAVTFQGVNGRTLLYVGLVVCLLGLMFGLMIFVQLRNMPVHRTMREISELIYETCKTYYSVI
jgi:hypothetical protein